MVASESPIRTTLFHDEVRRAFELVAERPEIGGVAEDSDRSLVSLLSRSTRRPEAAERWDVGRQNMRLRLAFCGLVLAAFVSCSRSQASDVAVTTESAVTSTPGVRPAFDPRSIEIRVIGPEDELGVNPEADYRLIVEFTNNSSAALQNLEGFISVRAAGSDLLVNHPFAVSETVGAGRQLRTVISLPVPDRVGRRSEVRIELVSATAV